MNSCAYGFGSLRVFDFRWLMTIIVVNGAAMELRFGPKNLFRVFYEVNHEEKTVSVLAIGVKEGNRLFIGGLEFEL